MAFSLPSDLTTSWVDDTQNTVIHASDWNNVGNMSNGVKAALATLLYGAPSATVATSETTASTSYTDLTTTTDQVTVAIGSSGTAMVTFQAQMANSGANYCYVGVDVSGANTIAVNDATCIQVAFHAGSVQKQHSNTIMLTGLTPGFTTFKLKYKVNTGTGTFANRRITVIPFPSVDGTRASGSFDLNASSSLSLGMTGVGINRPVFDAAATQVSNSATSLTWTHTATAGATVLVALTRGPAGSGGSATYDGNAMSYVGSIAANNTPGSYATTYLFAASNVAGGAKTVVASWTTAATGAACSVSYTGVAGLGQVTVGYGSSATPTQTVAATHNDGRLLVCAQSINGGGSGTITGVSGGTQRALAQPANHYYDTVVQDATGNSVSFGVTPSETPSIWGGVSVELLPTVPTYSTPTWVGTGLGAHRVANPGTSWVDTVPADANLAVLWVSEMPSDQANTCTVTLGGTSMVEVTGSPWVHDFTANYNRLRCFILQNPSTGPNKTVAITSNVSNYFHAQTVYYGGVTAVAPATLARGVAATQTSMTLASTASNHLYAQAFVYRPGGDNTFSNYSGNQRAVHRNDGGGYTNPLLVGDVYGNGGALTISATRSDTTNAWGGVALDLSPSALPTPSTPTWVGTGAGRPHITGNYSWTETVPANATLAVLWVSVMGSTAVSATLGGTAMVPVSGSPFPYYSGNYTVQAFYLLNPATGGGKTLALTNSNGNNHHAVVTYYAGVGGVFNPITTSTGAAGQQPQLNVQNSQSNHLYVNAMAFRPSAAWDAITGYDQTKRIDHPCYSYDLPILVGDAVGNGSTLAFNGTRNNTTYEWGGVTLDLSPDVRPAATMNLALSPTIAMAAQVPTFDAAGPGNTYGSGTNFSWTHVVGANAKACVVFVNMYGNGIALPTITANIGGTTLVTLGTFTNYTSSGWPNYTAILGCLNPPTGSKTVSITLSGAAYTTANSLTYNNVGSFGRCVGVNQGGQTTGTYTTTATTSDLVVAGFAGYTTNYSGVTSGTQRGPNFQYNTSMPLFIADKPGSAGTTTITAALNASGETDSFGVVLSPFPPTATVNLTLTPAIAMACPTSNPLGTPVSAFVATSETTASGTYADLTTTTDSVTVDVPASGMALVSLTANAAGGGYYVGFAMSGANTQSAHDGLAFASVNSGNNWMGGSFLLTGLNAGSTTFKMKYKTGTFSNRRITVTPVAS